ncbi:hypothetical protein M0804_009671 [Polistes exclamans]|nr:hypothetical protein M0804_009671 [Polistes exclamans]
MNYEENQDAKKAGSLSSCCHGDAQVNLTWANSQRHTDARYAIPLFIWFLHGGSYFAATSLRARLSLKLSSPSTSTTSSSSSSSN